MGEIEENIIDKNSISLSRNSPVALVVGAAGFLGSCLSDELLRKNIQVIGVDNFSTGKRRNLKEALRDKNFHFFEKNAEEIDLSLSRLDYVFIVTSQGWRGNKLLEAVSEYKPKIIFVSSIELYDSKRREGLDWLRDAESKLAEFATENNINARVLRLAAIFGPRMHFREKDPIVRLIYSALKGDLQESTALEFSTRSMYIDDALSLIIKSMLSGSTALKIYDGVAPTPVKVSEIKQVLLDPIWYESRGFGPTELPPWLTPNLIKTQKELNFSPRSKIVTALKETIAYFKDNEIEFEPPKLALKKEIKLWVDDGSQDKKPDDRQESKKQQNKIDWQNIKGRIIVFLMLVVMSYALVYPVVTLIFGVMYFGYNLSKAADFSSNGQFSQSLEKLNQAQKGIDEASNLLSSFEALRKVGRVDEIFWLVDQLVSAATYTLDGARHTVSAAQALNEGMKAVTGERSEDPQSLIQLSQTEFSQAEENTSKASLILKDEKLLRTLPVVARERIRILEGRLDVYNQMIKNGRVAATILPKLLDNSQSYLLLVLNNSSLRPGGGVIEAVATIDFDGGKLKKIEVLEVGELDKNLAINVKPPTELKDDLNLDNWSLKESGYEPDFPSSARQAEWFYSKEAGKKVQGVIAINFSALEDLVTVNGPIPIPELNETISGDNFWEKVIYYHNLGDSRFITLVTKNILNKVFFTSERNWPKLAKSITSSLENKHIMAYFLDTSLFSYIVSLGYAGVIPRPEATKEIRDFLALSETNLSANLADYFLQRDLSLETSIDEMGLVSQRFKATYILGGDEDSGELKNRLKLYLPLGSRLSKVLWGEEDITDKVKSFSDYGRSGFSFITGIKPKEQMILVVDYGLPFKVDLSQGTALYNLSVHKQPGTLKDPLEWRINYPLQYKLDSAEGLNQTEKTIKTDLSKDRNFSLTFTK